MMGSAKVLALMEVVLVRFGLLAAVQMGLLKIPGFMDWQFDVLGYPFTTGASFILVTLLLLVVARRDLKVYGLNLTNPAYHLGVVGLCFISFVLAGVPIGLGANYQEWSGALILSVTQIGLLLITAWLLRKNPSLGGSLSLMSFLDSWR